MKVFLSWSGVRSKHTADALRNWLPKVLQAIKPWMSNEDIAMGTRWSAEISGELEQTKVGIVCLTAENQHNPWIMFETGALSKTLTNTYVCPYLIDLSPSQISGPISQFQSAPSSKEGTCRIIQTLNRALGTLSIPESELNEIFDVWWPRLEQQLQQMPDFNNEKTDKRKTDEILEEVVRNTREQLRREEIRLESYQIQEKKQDQVMTDLEILVRQVNQSFGMLQNFTKEIDSQDLISGISNDKRKDLKKKMLGMMPDLEKMLGVTDQSLHQSSLEDGSQKSILEITLSRLQEMQEIQKQQDKRILDNTDDQA